MPTRGAGFCDSGLHRSMEKDQLKFISGGTVV